MTLFLGDGKVVSAEQLFASPVCWKPYKICQFFAESNEYIRDGGWKLLKEKLNSNSKVSQKSLWLPYGTWKDVLGDNHYNILAAFTIQGGRRIDTTSVVDLLRIIRNKYVHNSDFTEVEKRELGWFEMKNGSWYIVEALWAQYWTTRFPQLLPWLWENLVEARHGGKLQKFYPKYLEPYSAKVTITSTNFWETFQNAMTQQLNQGILNNKWCLFSS